MLCVALLTNEFSHQTLVGSAPANGQPPLQFLLDSVNLLIQLRSRQAVDRTCRDCIHRGELEETDRFLHMMWLDRWRERHLGI